MACDISDIHNLGTILGVWAHPDDETWASAGIMRVALENGQRVACVTATRGDAGRTADESKWPQKQLRQIREQEMQQALDVIGVSEHYWLDYDDGVLDQVDLDSAAAEVAKVIEKVQPDTVLTFGPDGLTGHPDHRVMCEWAKRAVEVSGSAAQVYCATEVAERYESIGKVLDKTLNIYFATDKPLVVPEADIDLCFCMDNELLATKKAALMAHASQTTDLFKELPEQADIEAMFDAEGFMKVQNR